MIEALPFLRQARDTYASANAATLGWMLGRKSETGGFLDTKLNSLTLADYTESDGMRGPRYVYGWIQGRGLEALTTHGRFFARENHALSGRLDAAAVALYRALGKLIERDGHAWFTYDTQHGLAPVYPDKSSTARPQRTRTEIVTYSDLFVMKGLIDAAARFATADLPGHLERFAKIVEAIEQNRFQMDERRELGESALADEPADFGPRMILLGAAGMLKRAGLPEHCGWVDRFITQVLDNHFDPKSGLLLNVRGEDACNVGHGIEFVGFVLDWLPTSADPHLLFQLEQILLSSFSKGFKGPGIALSISAASGEALSPYQPWWSLGETIRAAALIYERTRNPDVLRVWQEAHRTFFENYWRGEPPIAYQTMTADGPVDFVPATPDLDPGYHTGLSLLAAIEVADRLLDGALQDINKAR